MSFYAGIRIFCGKNVGKMVKQEERLLKNQIIDMEFCLKIFRHCIYSGQVENGVLDPTTFSERGVS